MRLKEKGSTVVTFQTVENYAHWLEIPATNEGIPLQSGFANRKVQQIALTSSV